MALVCHDELGPLITSIGDGSHCRIPGYVTMAKRHIGEKTVAVILANLFIGRGVTLAKKIPPPKKKTCTVKLKLHGK